jgi:hypothetical protein
MTDDPVVDTLARTLVDSHREHAWVEAAIRAEKARAQGDRAEQRRWTEVLRAIEALEQA